MPLGQGDSKADTESWAQGPWSHKGPGEGRARPEGPDLGVEARDHCCMFWGQLLAFSVPLSVIRW